MSPLIVGSGSSGSEGRSDRFGLPTGTSDPGTAEAGDLYYKTDTNKIRVYDGSAWADLASGGGGVGGAAAYTLNNSLRFDGAAGSSLSRAFTSTGSQTTWTWSGWVKLSKPTPSGQYRHIFGAGSSTGAYLHLDLNSSQKLVFGTWFTGYFTTNAVFRDYSAWMHIVLVVDTTNGTGTDRIRLYVNGERQTFSSYGDPGSGASLQAINTNITHYMSSVGVGGSGNSAMDMYLCDVHFIDGSALEPTAFGAPDSTTGVWNPIEYTGSYPGNSFRLDFSSSGSLGTDVSGNNNSWSLSNIDSSDQMKDSPTNGTASTGGDPGGFVVGNYCTWNPYLKGSSTTLSNGNLDMSSGTVWQSVVGTIGVTSGKWYWEQTMTTNQYTYSGICNQKFLPNFNSFYPSQSVNSWAYLSSNGSAYNDQGGANAVSTTLTTMGTNGGTIGFALDLDNQKLWFSLNGTWMGSGSPNPATGTDATFTNLTAGDTYFPCADVYAASASFNFGQKTFAYQAPAGYRSLNTANLPTPSILNGSEYMDAVLYEGNNSTQTVPLNFDPDFMWLKCRNLGRSHRLVDTVRGLQYQLFSDGTDGGSTYHATSYTSSITATSSSGFTVNNTISIDEYNTTGETYVAWAWDAGNSAPVTNTDGTTQSLVKAFPSAGFSIVKATLSASSQTLGHGLGVEPAFVMRKAATASSNWYCYIKVPGYEGYLLLDTTAALVNQASGITTTVFNAAYTGGTVDWINYCFAPIENYSAIGTYSGNSSTDGRFVWTGFRVRWLLIKAITGPAAGSQLWYLYDSARDTYNVSGSKLFPDNPNIENSGQTVDNNSVDLLSNGFKCRSTNDGTNSGHVYFYMAFAENPFSIARAR